MTKTEKIEGERKRAQLEGWIARDEAELDRLRIANDALEGAMEAIEEMATHDVIRSRDASSALRKVIACIDGRRDVLADGISSIAQQIKTQQAELAALIEALPE